MSRIATVIATLLLASLLFWLGLLVYDSTLTFVAGDYSKRLVSISTEESIFHKLKWALALALAGASVGFSALLHGRFSKTFSYKNVLTVYFLVGLIASIGWTRYLSHQTSRFNDLITFDFPETVEFSMPLSSIPLHHIGLLVSGTLLLIAVARILLQIRPQ
jgi:multisubunit Na+/H+ antiporter MnhF subunit